MSRSRPISDRLASSTARVVALATATAAFVGAVYIGAAMARPVAAPSPATEDDAPARPPFSVTATLAPIDGVVLERVPVGSYVYFRIGSSDGERVVASLAKAIPPGAPVTVHLIGREEQFRSARLARTLPEVYFGIVRLRADTKE